MLAQSNNGQISTTNLQTDIESTNPIIDEKGTTTIQKHNKNFGYKAAEKAVKFSQEGEFPKKFQFEGYDFVLFKNVFSPIVFKVSSIYVNHLPIKEHQKLLDMGCGSGIIGISTFLKYNLDKVVCADINQFAVDNTIENIKIHNISDKVKAVRSDVFSNIDDNEKFDLIFRNAPYFDSDFDKDNILYRSMYDENYEHIKKFILEGQNHLEEGGKIMIGFSTDRFPLEHACKLVNEIGYDLKIFYQEADSKGIKQEILEVGKMN